MDGNLLGADLERLFDLGELQDLGRWVLGVEPPAIGGDGARGSFAAALARRCIAEGATAALRDTVTALRERVDPAAFSLEGAHRGVGTKLGDFTLEEQLGEGGSGAVYRAVRGDARYRLKVFRAEATQDRGAVQRFLALNRRIAARPHASLPGDVELLQLDGGLAVAQSFIEGETLDARLKRTGPERLREIWAILRGTLEALGALHDRRIVHGNIALSNVLVVPDAAGERVVLLDAGADLVRAPQHAGGRLLSPEEIRGAARGPRRDVFAFGALLYELMSGRPALALDDGETAWLAPLLRDPDPLSFHAPRGWVTGELDEFVLGLLDRDPARRPADANVALEVLEALVELSVRRDSLLPEAELDQRAQALLEAPLDEVRAATLEAAVDQGADPRRIGDALRLAAEELGSDAEALAAKKRLLYRAAALYERSLADLDAAESAYQTLLAIEPEDDVASAHLERIYRRQGKHDRLLETLLARAEHAQSARERARTFARMGNLLLVELEDPEQALVAYTHALCADPAGSDAAEQIERLAGADAKAWTEVLSSCSAEIAGEGTSDQRSQLLGRMGRWYASRLKRPDLAVQCYQAMLLADPADDLALREMAALYREAGLWRELAGVLVLRADAAVTPALGRDLRAEAAEIRAERLDDAAGAQRLYEQVLVEDPAHAQACAGLAELYRRAGEIPACIAILERRAKSREGRERQDLLREIARIEENDLPDLEAAARRYQQIIADVPDDLDALRSLERIQARLGRYPELVSNLEQQLALALVPHQKVALLERMATIQADEFLDRAKAAELLESVIDLDATRESALADLERHYRALERWSDLARTCERHLELPLSPAARASELAVLAEVLDRLGQPALALGRWEGVLEIDPDNGAALAAVARLRATLGDREHALSAFEALANRATTPEEKSRQWASAARLLEERGDLDAAIDRYKRALEATPADAQLLDRLGAAYLAQGDARAAARLLERRIEDADTDWARAKLSADLATLARDHLGDPEQARATALRAVGYDPVNERALVLLADMAYEASELVEAVDLYEKVADRASDPALLARYADALSRTDNAEEALAVAERLLAAAPGDEAALARGARLAATCGAWPRAATLAERWLDKLDARAFADRGEALTILGTARLEAGDNAGARDALEQAARLRPDDPRPLAAVARILESNGQWRELAQTLERMLDREDADGRVELFIRLGEVAEEHLDDSDAAARHYLAALAERPKERRVLLKLLGLYSAGKDWAKLVDVILEITEIVADASQQAKYLQTAARVAREELGDKRRAVELLDRALALDPSLPDATAEAVELHQELGDVEAAVRVLEQRLRAVSVAGDRAQALRILDQLSDIHLSQLRIEDAITATEAAYQLAPESERRGKLLAELYASEPTRYASQAVKAQEEILGEDPYRPDPYETLHSLYTEAQRPDGVWCVCQALVALHRATAQQEAFFRMHRRQVPLSTSAHVTDDEWATLLVHPEADPQVTEVFRLIQPSMIAARTTPLDKLGYRADQRVNAEGAQGLALALDNAAHVLGTTLPVLVHDPAQAGAIAILRSSPGAIALGRDALSPDVPARGAAFVAAAHLAYFRPGLYARYLIATRTGLKAWLLGAIKLIAPRLPIAPELEGPAGEAHQILDRMIVGPARDRLAEPVSALLRSGATVDLAGWIAAVDLTADRAGLLLSDDLATAIELVRGSKDEATSVPVAERLKQLFRYSVSDAYLSLRAHLRVDVGRKKLSLFEV